MTANTPSSRKAKGRRLQQKIASDVVTAFGLSDTDVKSNPMGCAGMDIWLSEYARSHFPYAVEAKNQETWQIPKWWDQASINSQKENLKPLLIVSRNHHEPLAILEWGELLRLLKLINDDGVNIMDFNKMMDQLKLNDAKYKMDKLNVGNENPPSNVMDTPEMNKLSVDNKDNTINNRNEDATLGNIDPQLASLKLSCDEVNNYLRFKAEYK